MRFHCYAMRSNAMLWDLNAMLCCAVVYVVKDMIDWL